MSKPRAYYNENDAFCAQWLRNLMKRGVIAEGEVDERSIEDVAPVDLAGFSQHHFFAGIGVWSYALRCAGWPDDRPVWSGSCPCQPFSEAGKGSGFADERHLWPAWFHLLRVARPVTVFGEQVASPDGLAWLDLVSADLEGEDYACGALDTCATGVGAPEIRQRLYYAADNDRSYRQLAESGGLADADYPFRGPVCAGGNDGDWSTPGWQQSDGYTKQCGDDGGGLADTAREFDDRSGDAGTGRRLEPANSGFVGGGLADFARERWSQRSQERRWSGTRAPTEGGGSGSSGSRGHGKSIFMPGAYPGARAPWPENELTRGFWGDADGIWHRDRVWRPVEPGSFPLADGSSARMGRLRAYGNALVAEQAIGFIAAYLEEERNIFVENQ